MTGGMGFIGLNFIRATLMNHDDFNIVNLDRLSQSSNPANLQDIKQSGRYMFFKGDINDCDLVRDLAKDANAVVNFAAETHVDRSTPNPRAFFEANVHSEGNHQSFPRSTGTCLVIPKAIVS